MQLTVAELVVLGLVAEQPRHGYELEQVVERRGVRRWTGIAFSSIYYLLAKLERRGLVTAGTGDRTPKARRIVTVTGEGRRVAAADVGRRLADADAAPSAFLAALANQSLLSGPAVDDALASRLVGLDARLADVVAAEVAGQPLPRAALDVFSLSLALLRAERSWVAERVRASDERL